jgi:hypothetical protein
VARGDLRADAEPPRRTLICEGSPEMLIWRNLDPKTVAQLLVHASARWKTRNAVARKQRPDAVAAGRPAASGRGRPKAFGDD